MCKAISRHSAEFKVNHDVILILKAGWETNTHPLANASENLAGRVENRPGQVEFFIDYIRDCPVRMSAKKF